MYLMGCFPLYGLLLPCLNPSPLAQQSEPLPKSAEDGKAAVAKSEVWALGEQLLLCGIAYVCYQRHWFFQTRPYLLTV